MIYVVLSFDYELFLGKNYYDSKRVLFDPTYKILEILKDHETTATFFADVCSVIQHRKYGLDEYAELFGRQICDIEKAGADVQLHIHPNWLKSKLVGNQWSFDYDSYRIQYFDKEYEEWSMHSIVENCVDYLNSTIKSVMPEYKCVAYRAGGYAIQPYKKLFSVLNKCGIVIDSSVVLNDHFDNPITGYDFRNSPKNINWWVSSKHLMTETAPDCTDCTGVFEVPVMTMKNSLVERLVVPRSKRFYECGAPTGEPIAQHVIQKRNCLNKLQSILSYGNTYQRLSYDALNYKYLYKKLKYSLRNSDFRSHDIIISLIGHPKAFTGDAFDNFEKLINLLLLDDEIEIVNMKRVYSMIGNRND